MNIDILEILQSACLSNAKTFLQHYKKEKDFYEEKISKILSNIEN